MSQLTTYVPTIVEGREKYSYDAKVVGVFLSRSDAVNALLSMLVKHDKISYDAFCDGQTMEETESDSACPETIATREDFVKMLSSKISGNFETLCKYCKILGDSYYECGWKVQIDEHVLKVE